MCERVQRAQQVDGCATKDGEPHLCAPINRLFVKVTEVFVVAATDVWNVRSTLSCKGSFTINVRRKFRFLRSPTQREMFARKTLPEWNCPAVFSKSQDPLNPHEKMFARKQIVNGP